MLGYPSEKWHSNPAQALKEFSKVTPRNPCSFISLLCISSRSFNSFKAQCARYLLVNIEIEIECPIANTECPITNTELVTVKKPPVPTFLLRLFFWGVLWVGCVPRNPFEEEKGFTLHCMKMSLENPSQIAITIIHCC